MLTRNPNTPVLDFRFEMARFRGLAYIISRLQNSTLLYYNTVSILVIAVVVDLHVQRIVLATEETTVTHKVSHRPVVDWASTIPSNIPIKYQSRLWSQRGTKVNESHHGDNPLLRPTGIQIATKHYTTLQSMAQTNIKTASSNPLTLYREQP